MDTDSTRSRSRSSDMSMMWWRRPRARATTSRVLPQGRAAARTTPRPDCRDKAQDSYPGWGGYRDKTESTCWGAGARGWSHRGAVGWKGVWVWTWGHWGEERKGGASRKRAQPGGGRSRQAAFRGRTGGMRRWHVPRRPNPGVRWSPLWWLTALRVAEASRWALSALLDTVDCTVERLACSSRGESAPLATTLWPPSCAHTTSWCISSGLASNARTPTPEQNTAFRRWSATASTRPLTIPPLPTAALKLS